MHHIDLQACLHNEHVTATAWSMRPSSSVFNHRFFGETGVILRR